MVSRPRRTGDQPARTRVRLGGRCRAEPQRKVGPLQRAARAAGLPSSARSRTLATQDVELMAQQRVFDEQLVRGRQASVARPRVALQSGSGANRLHTRRAHRRIPSAISQSERDHGASNRGQCDAALRGFFLCACRRLRAVANTARRRQRGSRVIHAGARHVAPLSRISITVSTRSSRPGSATI
jgi:hypothetical protein